MSRREKLLDKMRNTPAAIRFSEVEALLRYEGFVLFNQRGSPLYLPSCGWPGLNYCAAAWTPYDLPPR